MAAAINQALSNAVSNLKDAGNPFFMLVNGATNDDDNSSVAFYKLDEIKNATFQSRNGCELIHKAISQRLESYNPAIVYKTLQVCRTLLLEGPEDFKKMMYQTTGKIQNIANMRKNNPDTYYSKDSIEAENMALAEKVYMAVVGDVRVLASHDEINRAHKPTTSTSMGSAATGGYKSDFQMHQERERKAFLRRMHDQKTSTAIVGHAQFERFDSAIPPAKMVEGALASAKKKFAPEELNNFVEATFETHKTREVCAALDKALRDGKSNLVVRYKAISLVEALITEINEALEYFKVNNLGIHRHLSIEHGDNPTKSALTQKLAQRAMDIVHGKVEVPASTPPPPLPSATSTSTPEREEPAVASPTYFTPAPKVQPPGGRRQMTEAPRQIEEPAANTADGWGSSGWGNGDAGWGDSSSPVGWGGAPPSSVAPTSVVAPPQEPSQPPSQLATSPAVPNPAPVFSQEMLMQQMQQQMMLLQRQMMAASAISTSASPASPSTEDVSEEPTTPPVVEEEEDNEERCDEGVTKEDLHPVEEGVKVMAKRNVLDGVKCAKFSSVEAAGGGQGYAGYQVTTFDEPTHESDHEGDTDISKPLTLHQYGDVIVRSTVMAGDESATDDDSIVEHHVHHQEEEANNSGSASQQHQVADGDDFDGYEGGARQDSMVSSTANMAVPNNSIVYPLTPPAKGPSVAVAGSMAASMSGSLLTVPNNSVVNFGTPLSVAAGGGGGGDTSTGMGITPMSPPMTHAPPASPASLPAVASQPSESSGAAAFNPSTTSQPPSAPATSAGETQDAMMRQMQEFHRNMQMMMSVMMQQSVQRSKDASLVAPLSHPSSSSAFVDPHQVDAATLARRDEEERNRKAAEAAEKARRKSQLTQDLRELLGQMRATKGMLDEQKQQLSILKLKIQELS